MNRKTSSDVSHFHLNINSKDRLDQGLPFGVFTKFNYIKDADFRKNSDR